MRKFVLPLIFLLAFLLRVIWIDKYPVGFNQDEAGLGYDAYSILLTGKDQWGKVLPLTLRSFGDFKLPVYSYLTIPSVAIFGLNEFSVRLPSAICGTLAIVFTYLMVEIISKRKDLAIWSSLLLATSSWHISLSRGAFEANLSSCFLPLAVWLFYRGLEKNKYLWISSVFFGVNLFTYHSARMFTPLIVMVLILLNFKKLSDIYTVENKRKYLFTAGLVFLIFISVAGITMFTGAGKRATDVVIFNPTDQWESMAKRRFETISQGVPPQLARVFSNKPKYIFSQFVNNYLSYFSPEFLFIKGAGDWSYGMISERGVLYLFEAVFLLFGVMTMMKKGRDDWMWLIVAWLLLSPIPAAVSKAPGFSANRAAVMMPAIQIMSAYGIVSLIDYLNLKFRRKYVIRLFKYVVVGTLFISLLFFLEDYIYHVPLEGAQQMQYGNRTAMQYVNQIQNQFDGIFISRSLGVPQVWVEFYLRYNPKEVQKESVSWLKYEEEGYSYLDQLDGYRLGKYTFGSLNMEKIKNQGHNLLVGSPEEFSNETVTIKTIYYPDSKPAILIVDSGNL